jgi:hypothetical protein
LAVAFGTLLAGCHTYVPLMTPTPLSGTYVAATLTESGSAQVSGHLGPEAGVVRGRLLDDGRQGMTLSVQSVGLRRGDELAWRGEAVTLPHASISRVETRRLAKGRSLLLLVAGATVFVAFSRSFDLHARGTGAVLAPNGPGLPSQ